MAAPSSPSGDAALAPAPDEGQVSTATQTPAAPAASPTQDDAAQAAPATRPKGPAEAAAKSAPPAKAARSTPRLNSTDPRCADIIARVSLGELLSAAERAMLQEECRR